MRKIFLLLTAAALLSGCVTGPEFMGVCRHRAMYAASVFGEQAPVRIAWGLTEDGRNHVQAEAFIDGQWHYLKMVGNGYVTISERDNFNPTNYYSLPQYFERFMQWQKIAKGGDPVTWDEMQAQVIEDLINIQTHAK